MSGGDIKSRLAASVSRLRMSKDERQASRRGALLTEKIRTLDADKLRASLVDSLVSWGVVGTTDAIHDAMGRLSSVGAARHKRELFFAATAALEGNPESMWFADAIIESTGDPAAARYVAKGLAAQGAIARPLDLLTNYTGDREGAIYHRLVEQAALRVEGVHTHTEPSSVGFEPESSRRLLYHVSQSRPHHSSGYAIRTHYLMQALQRANWEPQVVARFGYPADRADSSGAQLPANDEVVDGIPYHFEPDLEGLHGKGLQAQHELVVDSLVRRARVLRPALIHSASNHVVGMAGAAAARALGIPSVYEVRGLWHMTRSVGEPRYQDSDHYKMIEGLEVQAARESDHVFAITEAIRTLLVGSGVPADKVSILPNAVDSEVFAPRPRAVELEDKLGLAGRVVFGFLGSMAEYEGLDDLLSAIALLRESLGDRVRVLVVGDGAARATLEQQAQSLGIANLVIFEGRVPHEQVNDYYSLMDVLCYPRKSARVCEFVSPLKPFEAMGQEKAVIVSSVSALAEIVDDGTTGLVCEKSNVLELAGCISRLVESPELRVRLGKNARAWVQQERTWERNAELVEAVYERLLGEVR